MLDRADETLRQDASPPAPVLQITVENFPGLCMGAAMLTSLSLAKIGYGALTEAEGKLLTDSLLKNAMAWGASDYLVNPRVAAGLDLVGLMVAILTPRIIADLQRRPPSPTQAAAAARDAEEAREMEEIARELSPSA